MASHWMSHNSYGEDSSFDVSRWRNNNSIQLRIPPNRIQGISQSDWRGLEDRRRENAPQPIAVQPQPIGRAQPTQQSQAPTVRDGVNIEQLGAQLRQSDELNRQEAFEESTRILDSPSQSPQQQLRPESVFANGSYASHHDISQPWYFATSPRSPTIPIEMRLREVLGAANSEGSTDGQEVYDQPNSGCPAAQSDDLFWSTNAMALTAHHNHSLQPPKAPHGHESVPPLGFFQPSSSNNMSAYPIYQIPFLGGYNSQQITYMSAQLSVSVPYHEVFPDEPALNWAMLAHAFDYAAPPREALAYFGTTWCQYWLPSQADFNNWNAEDVGILRAACAACNIWLDWALLDQFGVQAQLVRDPSESVALHGAWQEQAPERGFQTQTAHHLLLPTESQAKKYRQAGALEELSTPRDDDHVGPADDPAQADQSKLSLEESASVKSRSIEEDLLRNLLVYHAPSALNPPTSQLPNIGPRNREAATNLFLPARKGSVPQHDGEAAADRQSSSNIATQPAKSPRKKKELKRFEFELNAMLRPSNEIDTTIQLPTAANRAAYSPDTSWYKPKNPMEVGKVPETDEELRPYVLIMKKSMMDTSKAEDKKDERSSFRKRWSPAALAKRWPVSLEAMEAICWIIAKMARQYHRDGPAFLNLFDELHQARANRNQDLTFEERIETICTVLLISKARVDKCLKYESLGSLVAFPLSILGMSIANRPFNNTRKAKLEAGTKWLKQEAEERAKAEAEAAAKSATDESVPVDDRIASADDNKADLQDGAGEEVEEENEEIEDGEEVEIDEEEDDADEDADDNAEEDDDDDGDGGGEGDNEKSAGCAGGKTGFSPPDAISNVEADRDNAYQSGRANESNAPTSPSKALSTSNSIHQALTKPPSTPFSSRASGTKMSSKSPAHGVTVHYADPLLQLGLDLSPAPKRSRIAMCTNPDDAAMHSTPATIAQPTLAPPPKRRATEAGMGDTNTRGKSARSADRQIIAPKRRSAPKENANQGALPLEAGLGKNGSV